MIAVCAAFCQVSSPALDQRLGSVRRLAITIPTPAAMTNHHPVITAPLSHAAAAWGLHRLPYEGEYDLGTSLARPCIAKGMMEVAAREGATLRLRTSATAMRGR
jgi:hypothetical protein